MASYVLAHDLGTTGNKATLFKARGAQVGSVFAPYPTMYPQPLWAEQHVDDWWDAVCRTTTRLLSEAEVAAGDVAAIVFSGQMMGAVLLDADARPLRSAIIWADQRATEEVQALVRRVPPDEVYAITGHRLGPSYVLPKLMWLRAHQPALMAATHKVVCPKDALVARLTGRFVTDPSDASGWNLYDISAGAWSSRMAAAADLDMALLPEVVPSASVAGSLLPAPAAALGLRPGTPVVVGAGDGATASVGAGSVAEGVAYAYIGSSAWVATASATPLVDATRRTFTFCHAVPGLSLPMGTMQAAGTALSWAKDVIADGNATYDTINAAAAAVPPGANGLLFLPYLLGERSPHWNPHARGAFVGLTVRHTRADMLRAVFEGVALNLAVIVEALRTQGAAIDALRLIGGGAQSALWTQMLADATGVPVARLTRLEDAPSLGAAVIGGVAVGLFPDFAIAASMNPVADLFTPDAQASAVYTRLSSVFLDAYDGLAPTMDMLGAF